MSETKQTPIPRTLANHIDNHPSIFANSFINVILLVIFYVLGSLLSLLGIILLIEAAFRSDIAQALFWDNIYTIFELKKESHETMRNIFLFLGVTCMTVSGLFLLIARLTRMILRRNGYLLNLVIIKDDLEEAAKQESEAV